jgi:hypothetical protein
MFFRISNAIKKIVIQELQTLFNDHPVFGNGNLVITNKFQFPERPKFAIVVKTSTSDSIKLALDNYKGIVESYTVLANLKNRPGRMIEWVREDVHNIANVVKPGFYVVEMTDVDKFVVKPYLSVVDEVLQIETDSFKHATLQNPNVNVGSDYILTEDGRRLQKDDYYTIDYTLGEITFLKSIDDFGDLTIDYQYIGTQTGPYDVQSETINHTAIPGVILAFGNFLVKDSVQVVVVYPDRQQVAKAYLGKWKMNLSLSAVAQDTDTQEQLADLTAMYIWSVLQDKLVDDGIYIDTISIGGEAEEEEVATSNELAFTADISCSVEVEWEAYQPILGVIKKVFLTRVEDFGQYDDAEFGVRSSRLIDSTQRGVDYKVGMQPVEDLMPYLVRPLPNYSLIGSNTKLS